VINVDAKATNGVHDLTTTEQGQHRLEIASVGATIGVVDVKVSAKD
jgi:hypothetical protein